MAELYFVNGELVLDAEDDDVYFAQGELFVTSVAVGGGLSMSVAMHSYRQLRNNN